MADEIKNEIVENENVENAVTENEGTTIVEPKKEKSAEEIVKSIFNRTVIEEKNAPKPGEVKKPVNIFSRPIPVLQNEEARKARIKINVIEGLLFGAFLTAITAINAYSGIADKISLNGEAVDTPSFWFFLFEFVFFSAIIGVGDYFLTERRVNNYNASVAGINVNIDDEIENALKEQEEDGITAEDAAAANKSNGEEEVKAFIDIRCTKGGRSLTNKTFEAYIDEELVGSMETVKGVVTDANGFETILIRIKSIEASEGDFKNGVIMELINAAKAAASDNALAAIAISKSVYGDFEVNLNSAEKYNITYKEELKVQEAYPGALMGISGELK